MYPTNTDWPFSDRGLGGGLFFPAAPNPRRNNESKDIGEPPEMWQVGLADEKAGVVEKLDDDADSTTTSVRSLGIKSDHDEKSDAAGDLTQWQPLAVTSLTTTQAPIIADNSTTGTSRPTNLFARTFSSNRNDSLYPPIGPASTLGMNGTSPSTSPDAITQPLPLHLTYIIAMPQPAAPPKPAIQNASPFDDDEQDIPHVELGTTVITLESSSASTYPTSRRVTPLSTSTTDLESRAAATAISLRDVLGLAPPVQRPRRERRRDREAREAFTNIRTNSVTPYA